MYRQWRDLYNLTMEQEVEQMLLNDVWKGHVNLLLPLIDVPNHYHPKKSDLTDIYPFALMVSKTPVPSQRYHPHMKGMGLATSHTELLPGDEVDYVYNPGSLEAFKLLSGYGFAVDNNPSANVVLRGANHLREMSGKEIALCIHAGCLDSFIYTVKTINMSAILQQSYLQYDIKKHKLPNTHLMSSYRVKSINVTGVTPDEIAAWRAQKPEDTAAFSYSNEVFSIMKYASLGHSFYLKGAPISFDIATIKRLEQDPGAWSDEDTRRKILTHKVTVAKKQAKQLNIVYSLERGIDLIHTYLYTVNGNLTLGDVVTLQANQPSMQRVPLPGAEPSLKAHHAPAYPGTS